MLAQLKNRKFSEQEKHIQLQLNNATFQCWTQVFCGALMELPRKSPRYSKVAPCAHMQMHSLAPSSPLFARCLPKMPSDRTLSQSFRGLSFQETQSRAIAGGRVQGFSFAEGMSEPVWIVASQLATFSETICQDSATPGTAPPSCELPGFPWLRDPRS